MTYCLDLWDCMFTHLCLLIRGAIWLLTYFWVHIGLDHCTNESKEGLLICNRRVTAVLSLDSCATVNAQKRIWIFPYLYRLFPVVLKFPHLVRLSAMSRRRSRSVLGGLGEQGRVFVVFPLPWVVLRLQKQLATITVMGRACTLLIFRLGCSLWSVIDRVHKKMFDATFSKRSPESPSSWFVSPPLRNIICLTRGQYIVPDAMASSDTFEGRQLSRGRRVNLFLARDAVKGQSVGMQHQLWNFRRRSYEGC